MERVLTSSVAAFPRCVLASWRLCVNCRCRQNELPLPFAAQRWLAIRTRTLRGNLTPSPFQQAALGWVLELGLAIHWWKRTVALKDLIMKRILLLLVLGFVGVAPGQDATTFTNKLATFTNLQGEVFRDVRLVRGDDDGIIYRLSIHGVEKTDETGRLCRLNLTVHGLEGDN